MKFIIVAALVAVALCQTRVVETAPAWNGWNGWNGAAWNGAWNGWNNWGWPATTNTIIESPDWWNDSWGTWDARWNGWNPSWGWNPAWGTRPATWNWGEWGTGWNSWNRPAYTTAGARVVVP